MDLCAEFRWHTSGDSFVVRQGLADALKFFKLDEAVTTEKDQWRQLAMRGGAFTVEEVLGLLDYCQEDVVACSEAIAQNVAIC